MYAALTGRSVQGVAYSSRQDCLRLQHRRPPKPWGVTPFELYYGIACRDTFSRILTDQVILLPQPPDEVGDAENARLLALAVKTSVCAFVQFARSHDQDVKDETAALLNQKGSSRTFVIGAMVKARFPPTQAELLATGRRSNHVSAWRGPCRVIDRLSSTTYRLVHMDSEREFERSISNLLPWKAQSRKKARNGQYDETVSACTLCSQRVYCRS